MMKQGAFFVSTNHSLRIQKCCGFFLLKLFVVVVLFVEPATVRAGLAAGDLVLWPGAHVEGEDQAAVLGHVPAPLVALLMLIRPDHLHLHFWYCN